jgi:hypothetical protein
MLFDERAGIMQFDGGLSTMEAEARARAVCEPLRRRTQRLRAGMMGPKGIN